MSKKIAKSPKVGYRHTQQVGEKHTGAKHTINRHMALTLINGFF
jgi:hypothetical protein